MSYLPQDEAVASGLGAEEGGSDPVESQRVVDLLNGELSRLLRLKPREFWREGICGLQLNYGTCFFALMMNLVTAREFPMF